MIKKYLLLVIFSLFIFSCTGSRVKQKLRDGEASYKKIAAQKYLLNVKYLFSPDSMNVACYKVEPQSKENYKPQFKFFIYNLKTNKIVFEDNSRSDKIEWIGNSKLRVSKRPGIVSVKPEENRKSLGYVYDLTKHKKSFLNTPDNLNSL